MELGSPEAKVEIFSCTKCGGTMEQGFILEKSQGNHVSFWCKGPPEESWWAGLKATPGYPIGTFRCASCGYLESYARREFAAR